MDRITRLRIRNVRSIESLDLDLSRPFTVLIGENGGGKSTILECLEILRKAAEPGFMSKFYSIHRGLPALLRKGATSMELGVVIEDDEEKLPRFEYRFELAAQGAGAVVSSEELNTAALQSASTPPIAEATSRTVVRTEETEGTNLKGSAPGYSGTSSSINISEVGHSPINQIGRILTSLFSNWNDLAISRPGAANESPEIHRLLKALAGIEVHLPFDTRASWAARTFQLRETMRGAPTLFPATRLDLLGINLANAWSELRNREYAHWERTMSLVRIGLGQRVDSVTVTPDAGGGAIHLGVRFADLPMPVMASDLSDGQLSWLAFVAMTRLNENRSLLAFDEPESHLHPHLLGGAMALMEETGAPVLLATHSDRLLESLEDPAGAVRVCSLNESGRAEVTTLDRDELDKWLAEYGDLGSLRAAGYLPHVLARKDHTNGEVRS